MTVLSPHVYFKIQRLFKAFECFSCTFLGKFNFQGHFKTVLYIQVLFKTVRTLSLYPWFKQSSCQLSVIVESMILNNLLVKILPRKGVRLEK